MSSSTSGNAANRPSPQAVRSPFSIRNVRLFIAFRILFNARFYYPVFTVLFLDYGLTIEQFALLNTVWAITIVLAEVPSGALADLLGRQKLLLGTSLLMTLEMAVLAFVPLGNMDLIFWCFLINRVLSGLAEAMASGADEALAYDALVAEGDKKQWPQVLSVQMRLRSVASVITMTVGALMYDPGIVNRVLQTIGIDAVLGQQQTMRFPVYLTLILALLATATALQMRESIAEKSTGQKKSEQDANENDAEQSSFNIAKTMRLTLQAGLWIGRTPFALAVILFAMCFDHILRMIVTMNSQYYRTIEVPEAFFGLIGSGIGLLGLYVPKLAEKMVTTLSPRTNLLWVAASAMTALIGLCFFVPYLGVLPMVLVFVTMMLVSFFTSHYLNQVTESHQRATVLSFKGLAFNLAYGLIGFFFAMLMKGLKDSLADQATSTGQAIGDLAFKAALGWFPWYALVCLVITAGFCFTRFRSGGLEQTGSPADPEND